MQSIKLYFAGDTGGTIDLEYTLGVKNRLVSFAYPNQLKSWLEITKDVPGNIIVDSGAFSAWNKKRTINLYDYINYAHKAIKDGTKTEKNVRIVNLDVIPGEVGMTALLNKIIGNKQKIAENKDLINSAAKQGYKNLKIMLREGISPIHVFHQGEHWRWLDRMLKYIDYIGISPANDISIDSKKKWIHSVFEYLYKNNIKVNTHGFAVWIPDLLKDLPWTSCDAASWRLGAIKGNIYYPNKGFKNPDFSRDSKSFSIIHMPKGKNIKGTGVLTSKKLKMIERDGHPYEELLNWIGRAKINIKFFLVFEKWLNEYKKGIEYKPRIRLF